MVERNRRSRDVGSPEPLARIRGVYSSLSRSAKKVADYVLDHPDDVIHTSIKPLAEELGVSEASIVRFCQRLGYRGYPNFRIFLARDIGRPFEDAYESIERTGGSGSIVRQVFEQSVLCLNDCLAALDMAAMEKASKALIAAGRIFFYGVGGSGDSARVAHKKFLRAGIPCDVCTDPHLQALVAATSRPGDVALGISYSGGSDDVTRALNISHERGATTIALVSQARSPVGRAADVVLVAGGTDQLQVSEPGTSRLVQIAVLDALYAVVATHRPEPAAGN